MKSNDGSNTSRSNHFNVREAKEQQIITVAALCFAVVSWMATARGLQEYIFSGGIEASLISFGVQSILFVLNLRLPFFIDKIGDLTPEENRTIKFKKGINCGYKKTIAQKITIAFYIGILVTSSFFSFVYIGNELVYKHDTGYADDNTILMNFCRENLNVAEKVIDENSKILPLRASSILADLLNEMHTAGLIETDEVESLETLQQAKELATQDLNNKQTSFEIAEIEYNDAKKAFDDATEVRFWKEKEYQDAKEEYETKSNNYTTAKLALMKAQNKLSQVEYSINNFKPSSENLVMEILVEFLKYDFHTSNISSDIDELVDYIIDIGNSGKIPSNYADMVEKIIVLNNLIDDYDKLKNSDSNISTEDKIQNLKDEIEKETVLPNPQSEENFEQEKIAWTTEWKNRLENLREVVWSIPTYSSEEIVEFKDNGIDVNQDIIAYDPNEISNKIDGLIRNKLTDINVIEKVCLLLVGEYPLTTFVALLIALELDMISLCAGIVVYWMNQTGNKSKREDFKCVSTV